MITAVANEARVTLQRSFPPPEDYVPAAAPVLVPAPSDGPSALGGHPRLQGRARHDPRDRPRRGWSGWQPSTTASSSCCHESVSTSPPEARSSPCTAALHPTTGVSSPASTSAGSRSLYQDPTFGVRQLVDVATQALSPAINQMTTAVNVIDRLQDLMLRIGRRPVPSGMFTDARGEVRLVEPTTSSAYILELAFRGDQPVWCQLLARHPTAGGGVRRPRRRGHRRLARAHRPAAELLDRLVRTHATDPWDLEMARHPDRLGLG